MRRKIVITAVIILLLSSIGYGTYAYMSASKTAQNVITAGNVKIELNKVDDQLNIMPNTSVIRLVTITNTGRNDCYVRVKITADITPDAKSDANISLSSDKIIFDVDTDNWAKDSDGYWRYNKLLPAGNPPDNVTSSLLKGISFDKGMGNEYQNAKVNLNITAEAVQAINNGTSVKDVTGWPGSPSPTATH